jgi:hypothetical protein
VKIVENEGRKQTILEIEVRGKRGVAIARAPAGP